jgi:hypothetical protein
VIGQPTDHTSALGSPLLFTVSAQSRQHRIRPVAKLVSNLLDPKPGLFRNPRMLPQSERDCGIMTSGSLSDIAQRCPDRRTSHRRESKEPRADRPSFASGGSAMVGRGPVRRRPCGGGLRNHRENFCKAAKPSRSDANWVERCRAATHRLPRARTGSARQSLQLTMD